MAKKSTGREVQQSTAVLAGSSGAEKVDATPCGIQFETEEDRKGHIERHSCCNYTMYSTAYRQNRRL